MSVNVIVSGDIPKNATVIEAFPSRGYVSTLAANHIVRNMGFELVGHIECDKLDAVAVVHDGIPLHPIRIYAKEGVIILFSELIIPMNLVHEFTGAIADWFAKISPKTVLLLASIPGIEAKETHEIMAVTTDEGMRVKLKEYGVPEMKEGVLTGMSSSLMIRCCGLNIPATSLMVETSYIPDVLAAAALLEIINRLLGLQVDVKELTKAGKDIEEKFRDNLDKMKIGQDNLREMHQQLSMYR
jgi:uncharacterized protein